MAIVSQEQIYFMRQPFKKVIRVLRDGKFRIKYPQIIIDATQKEEAVGDTMGEAEKNLASMLREFESASTTKSKVILYKIQDEISFSRGMAVAVAASVYIEQKVTLPDGKEYFDYKEMGHEDNLPYAIRKESLSPGWGNEADNKLDWTPERQAFFARIHDSMKMLKEALSKLSKDRYLLLSMADSGIGLLDANQTLHETADAAS